MRIPFTAAVVAALLPAVLRADAPSDSVLAVLHGQADSLRALVTTAVAGEFLDAVGCLPPVEPRKVFYNREKRDALTTAEAAARPAEDLAGYEPTDLDAGFYYFTRYGTPLAFVRPLELLGQAGLGALRGTRIVDFGFGSVGQLRILASRGGRVTGVEVDPLLRVLYGTPADTGSVAACGAGDPGRLRLCFGQYPAEAGVTAEVGGGYDAFVSKNTLKHGYIHPAQEVDPRMLVHLGVADSVFVRTVYDALNPGGWFLIYNLCPPQSEEKYIPWADGRCPFDRELCEAAGFTVLAWNVDDTAFAREMGMALGWAEVMDLDHDLFGTYTLLRK